MGLLAALACTVLPTWVQAQAQSTQVAQPGRLLASNCLQCHGTNGNGPGFDKLAGKSASSLYKDMKDFQSGKEGSGIMASGNFKDMGVWFNALMADTFA